MDNRRRIRKILVLLKKAYGAPAPLKRSGPVDELVRTILSQNTTDKNSHKAFAVLKKAFRSWGELLEARTARVARLIRHAGLADIKANRIKEALAEIKRREGKVNLSNLTRLDIAGALGYLTSLKGVGPKTAACVLLFSFAKPVMPVDTHIFRVAKRLALISKSMNIEDAHEYLSRAVPRGLIYEFHLCIIEHGRRTCKAQNPRCGACCVYSLCRFERKRFFAKRSRKRT